MNPDATIDRNWTDVVRKIKVQMILSALVTIAGLINEFVAAVDDDISRTGIATALLTTALGYLTKSRVRDTVVSHGNTVYGNYGRDNRDMDPGRGYSE